MRAKVRGRLLLNRNREHEEINLQPDLQKRKKGEIKQ